MKSDLLERKLLFVTGKGGTGKSVVSAALGLTAARSDKRVLICELSDQQQVGDLLGEDSDVSTLTIDPQEALSEWASEQLGSRRLTELLLGSSSLQYLFAAAPGAREVVTLRRLTQLATGSDYDLVIVDAPASGHGIGLLRAPDTYREIARSGPIFKRTEVVRKLLRDRKTTGYVAVALPQEMPINEALELHRQLPERVGVTLDAIIVNGLYPKRFKKDEIERLRRLENRLSEITAVRAAISEYSRARLQRSQLRRLRRGVGDTPTVTLPFLFEPEFSRRSIEYLADRLLAPIGVR